MSLLVSRKAPNFVAPAVMPNGDIESKYCYYKKTTRYSVLFFYPLNFTFVCPSEIIALSHNIDNFEERNVDVITVSVDSQFSHLAWRNTPVKDGGIGPVNFTMVSDTSHEICRIYGVEHAEENVALRATFIIDQDKIVRAQFVNDLPLGRNIDEIIRVIDSLQHFETHGEVCPMNWEKGSKGMNPNSEGVKAWLLEKYPEQKA